LAAHAQGYIVTSNIWSRIKSEFLDGMTLMDNICPPSTQFAAYNKITAPKDNVIYPDYGHEGLPIFNDRSSWFMMGLKS